jgi:carbon-monoxide dehydrogenase small subunit
MRAIEVSLRLNGEPVSATVSPNRLLVDWLREDAQLPGTKLGCDSGACGVCTILVDGVSRKSCLMLVAQAAGHDLETIETLGAAADELHPLQRRFVEHGALQCGFCTPGMIMAARALLQENPSPTPSEVRAGLAGNLCRCTGYVAIVQAIIAAAEDLRELRSSTAAPRPA